MAEILKPRTEEQKQVVCRHCGATIGYYESEVKPWIVGPKFGRFYSCPSLGGRKIVCPSCGNYIMLDKVKED